MPTSSLVSQDIIINLSKLDSTEPLEAQEYIRHDILNTLKNNIIDVIIQNTSLSKNNDPHSYDDLFVPRAQNPCFFIHGGRGSGKSTLLRGIRAALIKNKDKVHIGSLAHIDPTEFAEGESFFVHILSRIAEKLQLPEPNLSFTSRDDKNLRKDALQILHEMSNGLKLLYDTKKHLHEAEDAAFFIEDSVNKCSSGTKLKHSFHRLMEKMCEIEKVDAFLITIDDADINFGKCSETLETVRKYMITPRIVIIFAGDMRLYSLVARGTHIRQFDATSLQYDDSRLAHRNEMLDMLEDQYMLKLFPVHNRMYLSNFDELMRYKKNRNVYLTLENSSISSDKKAELVQYIQKCTSYLYPARFFSIIEELYCEQPTRTMLQLLRQWSKYIPLESSDNTDKEPPSSLHEIIDGLTEGLRYAFSQTLIRKRIDFTVIQESNSQELLKDILLHTADLNAGNESLKLIGAAGTTSDKAASLYLNAESIRYLTIHSRIMFYIIFVNLIYQIASHDKVVSIVPETLRARILKLYNTLINLSFEHAGALLTAYIASNMNSIKEYGQGIICISKKYRNSKTESLARLAISENATDINKKYLTFRSINKLKTLLAIYHSICVSLNDRETRYYLSIYNFILFIVNILTNVRYAGEELKTEDIRALIETNLEFPSIRIDDVYNDKNEPEVIDTNIHDFFVKSYKKHESFVDKLSEEIKIWAKKHQVINGLCYPVYLQNAWDSFIAKCKRETDKAKLQSTNIGELVQAEKLFAKYLEFFSESLKDNLKEYSIGTQLSNCLKEFPLWKVLTTPEERDEEIWKTIYKFYMLAP